jgi:hypothetical protein
MRQPCLAVLIGLALSVWIDPAAAQFGRAGQTRAITRMDVRAGVAMGLLIGRSSDFLDSGTGLDASVRFRVDRRQRLSLRGDVAWIPLADDRDGLTGQTASNTLLMASGGPEIALALGWLEPYLRLFGGVTINRMEVEQATGGAASDRDSALTWGGGGGLRVFLGGTGVPMSLEVGAIVLDGGELLFARAPGTTAAPDGGLQNQLLADVGMVMLSAGLSVGLF